MNLLKKWIYNQLSEALLLKRYTNKNKLAVVSDDPDEKKASYETFKNKTALKAGGFKWDTDINMWTMDDNQYQTAQNVLNSINKKEVLINKLEDVEELLINSDAPNKNHLSDRIKLFVDDLANATDEAAADAKIKQYLNFFSKFRKHSFTNSL